MASPSLRVRDLGADVSYDDGMAKMRAAMREVAEVGTAGQLLLLEHQATITLTRSGGTEHLLVPSAEIEARGIAVKETDRGGNVTFHGPGQLVGYPVLRLGPGTGLRVNLLGYLRALEDGLVAAVTTLGVPGAHRKEGFTGVWIASDPSAPASTWEADVRARKLVAIGVGVGKGVTRHGFALNVTTALERFTDVITPCGLLDRPVTSLQRELSVCPSMAQVKAVVRDAVAAALQVPLDDTSSVSCLPLSSPQPHPPGSSLVDGVTHG